jgi:TolB-like protein
MKKKKFFGYAFISVVFFISCISSPVYFNKSVLDRDNARIAVFPFRDYNSNEGNNSGELVRSIFESRLMLRGVKVIEIEKVSSGVDYSVLRKQEFPSKWFVEKGEAIGADFVVYGSVHDYRVFQNLTSFLYLFEWLEITSSVGVTARMISCKTGEVVWSGSYTRSSYTFTDATNVVVNSLVRSIKYKSGKQD